MTGLAPSWVNDAIHEALIDANAIIDGKERAKSTQDGLREAALALDKVTEPTSRLILDLHQRAYYGDYSWHYHCEGCDTGCSCDTASWPCTTVRALAEHHGIPMPGHEWDALNRPKDGSLDAGCPVW